MAASASDTASTRASAPVLWRCGTTAYVWRTLVTVEAWRDDGDLDRAVQVLLGDAADLRRHRRGEQGDLTLAGRGGQDLVDVLGEAHAQHLVGLVEHEEADLVHLQRAALEVVEHAAGGADDDLRAAGQRALLRQERRAAVDREHVQAGQVRRERLDRVGDLHRELAGRGQDDGLDAPGCRGRSRRAAAGRTRRSCRCRSGRRRRCRGRSSRAGTACAWMAEGVVKPRSAIAASSAGGQAEVGEGAVLGQGRGRSRAHEEREPIIAGRSPEPCIRSANSGSQPRTTQWQPLTRCLDHTTRGGPRPAQRWWRRLEGGRDELQIRWTSLPGGRSRRRADAWVTSRTTPAQAHRPRRGPSIAGQASITTSRPAAARALGGVLVDDPELQPHGAGADGDRLVDDVARAGRC